MNIYTQSPFLPTYTSGVGSLTRIKNIPLPVNPPDYSVYSSNVADKLSKTTWEEWSIGASYGKLITSIEDTEDEILKEVPNSKTIGPSTYTHPKSHWPPNASLAILINRQANLIAARTRLGAGNVLLCSLKTLVILQSATTTAFARPDVPRGTDYKTIGRWKLVGTLNNHMEVYLGNHLSDDIVYVVGAFDKPGHANIIDWQGKMYLVTEPPYVEYSNKSDNFYGSVKIEYED